MTSRSQPLRANICNYPDNTEAVMAINFCAYGGPT